jgi:hypothetical protein
MANVVYLNGEAACSHSPISYRRHAKPLLGTITDLCQVCRAAFRNRTQNEEVWQCKEQSPERRAASGWSPKGGQYDRNLRRELVEQYPKPTWIQ